MYILQKKTRIREYLILCFGIIFIIGCQGAYVRNTNVGNKVDKGDASIKEAGKIEVTKNETKMEKSDMTNIREAIRKEDNKRDAYMSETVDKENVKT